MVGRDDYLNVLNAVREHVEAYERRLDEEWERLGVRSPKNLQGDASTD